MPNFVKVDSKPFHPDTYIGPEQEDEEAQQAETLREKSMSIKLKVENTLRWRWTKDGTGNDVSEITPLVPRVHQLTHVEQRRQSNSRVIRWSDGTLSLRQGKSYSTSIRVSILLVAFPGSPLAVHRVLSRHPSHRLTHQEGSPRD